MRFGKQIIFSTGAALLLSGGYVGSASAAETAPKALTAKEKADGAKAHPEILKEFGGAWQSPQTSYVVRVGKSVAVQSGLSNAQGDFTVTLLNSSINNAFAIPGGYIYITRQLVALCNSEAEMAGVLGHEVGHVAARHSEKRQKQATLANIFAVIATVGGAALGDNGGLAGLIGGGLKQYSGTVAQLFSLKYSRGQEEEADDLGIRYLSKAGYDPSALSSMLNSLALQTAIDIRVAGNNGSAAMPEWASTHPDPAKRVVRAANGARSYPANSIRKSDTHFAAINGMLYDDDPAQGVIDGQQFQHRDLRLKFSAPTGFGMANSAEAVSINGTGGQAIFTTQPYSGDRSAYVAAAFKSVSGSQAVTPGAISTTVINGIPAFYASAVATTKSGQVQLTVFAYEFGANQAFHFVTLSPVNTRPFDGMYQSMARLTANEAAAIKPRKIKIVSVARTDSVTSLASKMAYSNLQTERFLALNGLASNARLAVGQKVKIVSY